MPGHRHSKMRIRNPRIPIEASGPDKLADLDRIQRQIEGLTVVPDFGYTEKIDIGEKQTLSGWQLLFDYFKKEPKLVRL